MTLINNQRTNLRRKQWCQGMNVVLSQLNPLSISLIFILYYFSTYSCIFCEEYQNFNHKAYIILLLSCKEFQDEDNWARGAECHIMQWQ
jgi:hypothetical protein